MLYEEIMKLFIVLVVLFWVSLAAWRVFGIERALYVFLAIMFVLGSVSDFSW